MTDVPAIAKELIRATKLGLVEDVERLVRYPEADKWLEHALIEGIADGKNAIEVVRLLGPKFNASRALKVVAGNFYGTAEMVELLLPYSDPLHDDSVALRAAVYAGNYEIAAVLLPKSDPKAASSDALRTAALMGNEAMVAMLLPVSDAEAAWKSLAATYLKLRRASNRFEVFAHAAEHLCDAVSEKTLLKYAEEYPMVCALGPRVRARLASLKLDHVMPSGSATVARRARL